MGTTCMPRPAPGVSLEQFFAQNGVLEWPEDGPSSYRVLATAYKMPCLYVAVEQTCKATGDRSVWAMVIKITWHKDEICFKDMDESMGPVYADCPENILKLLTPTENEMANEWRARCWENIKKKTASAVKPGVILRYGGHDYLVLERLRGGSFKVQNGLGAIFKMTPSHIRSAHIVVR